MSEPDIVVYKNKDYMALATSMHCTASTIAYRMTQ